MYVCSPNFYLYFDTSLKLVYIFAFMYVIGRVRIKAATPNAYYSDDEKESERKCVCVYLNMLVYIYIYECILFYVCFALGWYECVSVYEYLKERMRERCSFAVVVVLVMMMMVVLEKLAVVAAEENIPK